MKILPPKKKRGVSTGRRTLTGKIKDVATLAAELGDTEDGIRAKVARGLIPYRRLGGRIVFLADEVDTFLRRLPGVNVDEALRNVAERSEGTA